MTKFYAAFRIANALRSQLTAATLWAIGLGSQDD